MSDRKLRGALSLFAGTCLLLLTTPDTGFAADRVARSKGQTLYATAYSYILMGDAERKFPVNSTLIIRNIDPAHPIVVSTADYRDSQGTHLRHYIDEPVTIPPLASVEYVVRESDQTGGHSPSFIIKWKASHLVNAPVVESLVIGGQSGRGISFVGRAWVIEDAGAARVGDAEPPETE